MGMTNAADLALAKLILSCEKSGVRVTPRNGLRHRVIGEAVRFTAVPLVVLRKTAWKTALREWEWFMSGSSNIIDLHPSVHHWWRPWADSSGVVRNNYSKQFRHFDGSSARLGFDQIAAFVSGIREHPDSSRHVITTWHTEEMYSPDTPITNCHGTVIQAFVNGGRLSLVTYQRSADLVCGVPHNWIQYWAFLLWLSHRTGYPHNELVWIGGDVHLYDDHLDMAARMRAVYWQDLPAAPDLVYTPSSDAFLADDFTLSGPYQPAITDTVKMVV